MDLFAFDGRTYSSANGTGGQTFSYNTGNPLYSGNNNPRVFDTWFGSPDNATSTNVYDYQTSVGSPHGYLAGTEPPSTPAVPPGKPTSATIPLRIRVIALQIKIRIWDRKSQETRQLTFIQDVTHTLPSTTYSW
jgi:hypothetical protein